MKSTSIDLSSLVGVGKTDLEIREQGLFIGINSAIHDIGYNIYQDKITSYAVIPGKYQLPMQLNLTVSINMPELLLLIGNGHISFGSPWMENRRIEDIAAPAGKPKIYDNQIPLNTFVDISVIYNLKAMQILINGKERYFSTKERYMKARNFSEQNAEGFSIGITCTKGANMQIRSITVTEFEAEAPFAPHALPASINPAAKPQEKPTFESCIDTLPPEIKEEIIKTDSFLKSLGNMKFRRRIEKHGNKITYVESRRGVSYAIYLSGCYMHHSIQWYIIANGKPEQWYRKDNPLDEFLVAVERKTPELADRIFYNLNECIGCLEHCRVRTPYTYKEEEKITCHGHIFFKMRLSDFLDVRDFFKELNEFPITL